MRIVATYSVFGNIGDEAFHLATGVEYWAKHVDRYQRLAPFDLNLNETPPLSGAMVSLGLFLAGARPQGRTVAYQEGMAIINYQHHPELTLELMRIGVLPFFFLACFVVWFWAARAFGKAAAVLATALFTLLPPVLAHASIACTDMAVAACLGAAFLTLILWAERPTVRELGATSVSFGAIGAPDDEFSQIFPGLPPVQHIDPLKPSEGYTAVSPTLWRAYRYELDPDYKHPNVKLWFEQFQPQERVGSLLLYYIPPGSLRRAR